MPLRLSHQHSPMDVGRLDLGRDRAQGQVLAQEYATAALQCQNYRLVQNSAPYDVCTYRLFGVFYNSGITQTLILERSAIMPF